jgi:transcriptional regulator with XRE-family HTH domain
MTPTDIYQYRIKHGLTQMELADKIGVSFSVLNHFENGRLRNTDTFVAKARKVLRNFKAKVVYSIAPVIVTHTQPNGQPFYMLRVSECGRVVPKVFATKDEALYHAKSLKTGIDLNRKP